MNSGLEALGFGLMILCICFGCAHCEKTNAEIRRMDNPPTEQKAE